MSLLNQMLTDLEQRRVNTANVSSNSGLNTLSPPQPRRLTALLISLVCLAGAGAGTWWYLNLPGEKAAEVAVAQAPVAMHEPVPAAPAPVPVPVMDPVAAPVETAATAVEAPKPPPKPPARVKTKSQPKSKATNQAKAKTKQEKAKTTSLPQARKIESAQQKGLNLYRQGLILLQQGRNDEAVQLLKRSLQIYPDGLEIRQTLAVTLMMQGRGAEAESSLRDGLLREPGHPALSQLLARLLLESGQLQMAQTTLQKALPSAGQEPQFHSMLGLVHQRQNHHQDAVRHYLVALRSDPSMPSWLLGAALSWQALGMRAEAREALERALQSGRMNDKLTALAQQKLAQLY
jgi:MSHA biogenesis protein MshN